VFAYLFKNWSDIVVNRCLALREQDAVPGRPLDVLPPPDEVQVAQDVIAAQDRLGVPKVLDHVADVGIL
jgi:hypothetical protein